MPQGRVTGAWWPSRSSKPLSSRLLAGGVGSIPALSGSCFTLLEPIAARMRFVLLALAATGLHASVATAAPVNATGGALVFTTPKPRYPRVAKEARIEGSGIVDVRFDAHGKPSRVEMIQSTGSLILDKNTTMTVEQYWRTSGGRPAAHTPNLAYPQPPQPPAPNTAPPLPPPGNPFFTPHPPYPQNARQQFIRGSLTVRITYGAQGGPVRTELLRSSGSALLDGYTADYIRLHWKCYNQVTTVHTTTVEYILR